MRIFITGADGFIGQHMVQRLKGQHELEFLTEDLRDHAKVAMQISTFDPEIIVPTKIAPMWQVRLFARFETTKSWFGYTPAVSSETVKEYMGKITNYDSSKAKDVLGWNPMDLEDSIRDTLNWIKHKLS